MSDKKRELKLLQLFAVETQEAIQTINQSCLLLEKQPSTAQRDDLLATILRQAHNLKGAARALELTEFLALVHRLENLFEAIRQAGVEPNEAVFDLIYQTLDGIGSLSTNSPLDELSADLLLNRLDTAVANINSSPVSFSPTRTETTTSLNAITDASTNTIRISVDRLDAIFSLVNELQVNRLNLEHSLGQMRHLLYNAPHTFSGNEETPPLQAQLAELVHKAEASHRYQSQVAFRLQEDVRLARMLPLATVFEPLPRIARDLARELGKEVALHLEGEDIKLDRAVLEQLKSPLQHLLYNSIDHGLETPEKRRAAGKPDVGRITILAVQRGSGILLEISDDGAGIDLMRVKDQAIDRHMITAEAALQCDDQELLWMLFQSGFSLASTVSAVSGRGVGLDVVRQAVENLHGLIAVESRPGQGTRFSLSLPLSIATSLCLLVRVNSQVFALPARHVTHLTHIQPGQIEQENGRLFLRHLGEKTPAVSLAHSLGIHSFSTNQSTVQEKQAAVLIGTPEKPVALLVDELCEVQEIAIKKLPSPVAHMAYFSGASILGTGVVILVLSVTDLVRAGSVYR